MPAVANISWSTRGHLFCVVFTTAEFQFPPQQYLEPATRLSLKNTVKTDTIGGGSVELRGEAITLSASFPRKEKSITDIQQITAWPMPNIKYLEVETSKPPPVPEAFWGLLFRKLDLVEKIRVKAGRRAVRDFASFISRIDEHRYVEGTLLPLLSHVLIWVDEKCDATEELMHLSKKKKPIHVGIWEELGVQGNVHRIIRPEIGITKHSIINSPGLTPTPYLLVDGYHETWWMREFWSWLEERPRLAKSFQVTSRVKRHAMRLNFKLKLAFTVGLQFANARLQGENEDSCTSASLALAPSSSANTNVRTT
ncbi:hypothetical protein CPC08DRAFT_723885 [Agrocybe pediades]|nr:hypothetical protein CPC08DRAFT_723885 [Agrocybe pediades]